MEELQKHKMNYSKADLSVSVDGNKLNISIKNTVASFDLASVSKRLANASEDEKKHFRVSASGYGIHWYLIDEDISIPALLNESESEYKSKN